MVKEKYYFVAYVNTLFICLKTTPIRICTRAWKEKERTEMYPTETNLLEKTR